LTANVALVRGRRLHDEAGFGASSQMVRLAAGCGPHVYGLEAGLARSPSLAVGVAEFGVTVNT
jgi:hypothetical protein